jgi:hypothetical protein
MPPTDKKALLKKQKDAVITASQSVLTTNQVNLNKSEANLMGFSPDQRKINAVRIANTRIVKNEDGLMTVLLDNGTYMVLSDLFLNGEKLYEAARSIIKPGTAVLYHQVTSAAPAKRRETEVEGAKIKKTWYQIYAVMTPEQEAHWRTNGLLA